jgi:hypothetical protein
MLVKASSIANGRASVSNVGVIGPATSMSMGALASNHRRSFTAYLRATQIARADHAAPRDTASGNDDRRCRVSTLLPQDGAKCASGHQEDPEYHFGQTE